MLIHRLLLTLFLTLATNSAYALYGCEEVSTSCTESNSTKCITPTGGGSCVPVTRSCWKHTSTYSCYTGEEVNSCSSEELQGCYLGGTTCEDFSGSTCVRWTARWICASGAATCVADPPVNGSCDAPYETTCARTDPMTGVCLETQKKQLCYAGPPEQCSVDPNCTLVRTECDELNGNLCDQQRQYYSCEKTTQYCAQEKVVQNCMGDLTHGTTTVVDNISSEGFGEAVAYLALLDEMQRTMKPGAVDIFPGDYLKCGNPVFSGSVTNNCCSMGLKDEGSNWFLKCSSNEMKLAAARRSQRTHYVGSWCSNKVLGICLKKSQGYCAFPSVLSRVIQEQGRDQLATLAATGFADAVKSSLTFPYTSGAGGWGPVVVVNGNTVRPWQWPAYCNDAEAMIAAYQADPATIQCPFTPEVWFASCSLGDCGTLPVDPQVGGSGLAGWSVQGIDPTQSRSVAISRYAVVTGSCVDGTGACAYEVAAWPTGGGSAFIAQDIEWPLWGTEGGYERAPSALANYTFQPYSHPFGVTPTFTRIKVGTDGGPATQAFDLPLSITGVDYKLPTSPAITVTGHCDLQQGQCSYRFVAPVNVTAKPWGEPKNPDCSGFSVGEISVLDFAKMDLSEWVASEEFTLPDTQQMAANVQHDVTSFYDTYNSGGSVPTKAPSQSKAVTITPLEGIGEFSVQLKASSNWPQMYPDPANNTNPVTHAVVEWGDGATTTATRDGNIFVADHTYNAKGAAQTTYTVSVRLTTATGAHTVTSTVMGYNDTPAPGTGRTGGGFSDDTGDYTPSLYMGEVDGRGAVGAPAGTAP